MLIYLQDEIFSDYTDSRQMFAYILHVIKQLKTGNWGSLLLHILMT